MSEAISRDMKIGEILDKFPGKASQLAQVMTNAGLHCVGCGAATWETLEQGVLGHGFDEQMLGKLVGELNAVVDQPAFNPGDAPVVSLTSEAVAKIAEIMKTENKENCGLRLAVLPGGCAGFTYDMCFQDDPSEGDIVVEQDNVRVFVEANSAGHLQGTQINYVSTLQGSGFTFENPTAKSSCGCGKSFT